MHHFCQAQWRRSPLPFCLPHTFSAQAELYFNPRFLADDPAAVADLSGFEKGHELPPARIASIFT